MSDETVRVCLSSPRASGAIPWCETVETLGAKSRALHTKDSVGKHEFACTNMLISNRSRFDSWIQRTIHTISVARRSFAVLKNGHYSNTLFNRAR